MRLPAAFCLTLTSGTTSVSCAGVVVWYAAHSHFMSRSQPCSSALQGAGTGSKAVGATEVLGRTGRGKPAHLYINGVP